MLRFSLADLLLVLLTLFVCFLHKLTFNCMDIIKKRKYLKLEIRSVERGISPIAHYIA